MQIRAVTDADAEAICALFQQVFGVARSAELWRWFYRETPAGPGVAVVAVDCGRVVAHVGTVTRAFRMAGRNTLCGQSIDAMTVPDWQRRGLNRVLSRHLFQQLEQQAVEVVYGFSNRQSTPGALGHQGRIQLQPFPFLFRPLAMVRRPWRMVLRSTPRLPPLAAHPPEDARELWQDAARRTQVGIERDLDYLTWRYRRPGGRYLMVETRRGGRLMGLGVLGIRWQAGLRTAFVAEAFAADDDPTTWRQLTADLLDAARAEDCDAAAALAFPGDPARNAFLHNGFLPVPGRLVPEDVVLSVRATLPPSPPELVDPTLWRVAWGEHDLV